MLLKSSSRQTITRLAYQWGCNAQVHFPRVFWQKHGGLLRNFKMIRAKYQIIAETRYGYRSQL